MMTTGRATLPTKGMGFSPLPLRRLSQQRRKENTMKKGQTKKAMWQKKRKKRKKHRGIRSFKQWEVTE